MDYVIDLLPVKVIKPKLIGDSELVRYLDDFVILYEKEQDAQVLLKLLEERFAKFQFHSFAKRPIGFRSEGLITFVLAIARVTSTGSNTAHCVYGAELS